MAVYLTKDNALEKEDGKHTIVMRVTINQKQYYATVDNPGQLDLNYANELRNRFNHLGNTIYKFILQERENKFTKEK